MTRLVNAELESYSDSELESDTELMVKLNSSSYSE